MFPTIFKRYDVEFTDNLYDDQEWITSTFIDNSYQSVLDLACGTGRSSIELLSLSAEVTGIDNSLEALNIYREKTLGKNFGERLVVKEMNINQKLPEGNWDLILMVGNSIGVIESEEKLEAFMEWAHRNIKSGGTLLVSMTFPEAGTIPMGVEQKRRTYTLNPSLSYERSVTFQSNANLSTILLKYWKEDQLIHIDKLDLHRYSWITVRDLAQKYFGKSSIECDLKFSEPNSEERCAPYEVFFKFRKT